MDSRIVLTTVRRPSRAVAPRKARKALRIRKTRRTRPLLMKVMATEKWTVEVDVFISLVDEPGASTADATMNKSNTFHPLFQKPQKSTYHLRAISIMNKVRKMVSMVLNRMLLLMSYHHHALISWDQDTPKHTVAGSVSNPIIMALICAQMRHQNRNTSIYNKHTTMINVINTLNVSLLFKRPA